MARVVRFHRGGGPEVLQIDMIDAPVPGSGDVRTAVKVLGLNRAEAHRYLESNAQIGKVVVTV